MERCPNCRARYRDGEHCYRCGMELSQLLKIEAQAALWERTAVARLAAGDLSGADAAATKSLLRQHRPLVLMVQKFIRSASPRWVQMPTSNAPSI